MATTDKSAYQQIADQAASQYGVPADLFKWQIGQESSWNPDAFNPVLGAQGLGQFIPSTAAELHVDVTDPVSSIYGAAAYDAALFKKWGNWGAVLSHYGTVGTKSPQSVVDAANAQLAAIGAQPVPVGNSATKPASSGNPITNAIKDAWNNSVLGGPGNLSAGGEAKIEKMLFGFSLTQLAFIVLGLVLIAGGLYTLKPVQQITNTTVTKGAGAGLKHAGKMALGALTL